MLRFSSHLQEVVANKNQATGVFEKVSGHIYTFE